MRMTMMIAFLLAYSILTASRQAAQEPNSAQRQLASENTDVSATCDRIEARLFAKGYMPNIRGPRRTACRTEFKAACTGVCTSGSSEFNAAYATVFRLVEQESTCLGKHLVEALENSGRIHHCTLLWEAESGLISSLDDVKAEDLAALASMGRFYEEDMLESLPKGQRRQDYLRWLSTYKPILGDKWLALQSDCRRAGLLTFGKPFPISLPIQPPPPPVPHPSEEEDDLEIPPFVALLPFDPAQVGKEPARFVKIRASREKPLNFATVHEWEKLTESFEIQATPVTQLQWYLVMNEVPSKFKDRSQCDPGSFPQREERLPGMCKHHPVEEVIFRDVASFIEKLNSMQSQYIYNLPTEAEWEYVARAGTTSDSYGFDNDVKGVYAWHSGNSNGRTHAVATRKGSPSPQDRNELIYDLAGNIKQWTRDRDGNGTSVYRMIRGGGYFFSPDSLKVDNSDSESPTSGHDVGFRLVRYPK